MIAVAAPGAIIAALFALLFILAWSQWGVSITNTLNVSLPVVGHVLGGLIADGLNLAYAGTVYWFDQLLGPIAEFILRPIAAVENGFQAAYASLVNLYVAVQGIIITRIPQAIATANTYAGDLTSYVQNTLNAWVANLQATIVAGLAVEHQFAVYVGDQAQTYAGDLSNYVLSNLNAWVANLQATIAAGLAAERQFATQVYNEATAFTIAGYNTATAYANSLAAAGRADLSTAVGELETYAQQTATTAVGALVTDIDNAVSGALAGIYTDVDTAVQDTIGIISVGDDDILAALKAIPTAVPADLAGLASLVGVSTLTLTRYLRDCGIPNCRNLSQLGKDLQALLGLVEDASFLTFLIQLAEHPSGASALVESTFGGAINDTVSAFRSLVSI